MTNELPGSGPPRERLCAQRPPQQTVSARRGAQDPIATVHEDLEQGPSPARPSRAAGK